MTVLQELLRRPSRPEDPGIGFAGPIPVSVDNGPRYADTEKGWWQTKEGQEWTQRSLSTFFALHKNLDGRLIDFDLLPSQMKPQIGNALSLADNINDLVMLGKQLPTKDSATNHFLSAKITATIVYLQDIVNAREGKSPQDFLDFVEKTLGFIPEDPPDRFTRGVKAKLEQLLTYFGYTDGALGDRLNRYHQTRRIEKDGQIDGNSITALMREESKKVEALYRRLGLPLAPFSYKIEPASENDYWGMWVDGDIADGFRLRVNVHPRHKDRWIQGTPQRMALHEITAHLYQMANWAQRIKEGKLHPLTGLTTVIGPEQLQLEGLAQTIQFFLDYKMSPESELSFWDQSLRQIAWQRAFRLYATGTSTIDTALDEYNKIYPISDREQLRNEMEKVLKRPDRKGYQYIYGPSLQAFYEISQRLNPQGRIVFLKKMFEGPMTPSQIQAFYQSFQRQYYSHH